MSRMINTNRFGHIRSEYAPYTWNRHTLLVEGGEGLAREAYSSAFIRMEPHRCPDKVLHCFMIEALGYRQTTLDRYGGPREAFTQHLNGAVMV